MGVILLLPFFRARLIAADGEYLWWWWLSQIGAAGDAFVILAQPILPNPF
jgi:hypothetical protein